MKSAEKLAGKGADRLEEKSCGKYPTVINISGHDSPFDGQRASRREMEKKRKPSAQIQAKMAALAAAAAAGPPDGPLLPPQSPPAPSLALQSHKTFSDSICHTADNKITIQINPYVSQRFQWFNSIQFNLIYFFDYFPEFIGQWLLLCSYINESSIASYWLMTKDLVCSCFECFIVLNNWWWYSVRCRLVCSCEIASNWHCY